MESVIERAEPLWRLFVTRIVGGSVARKKKFHPGPYLMGLEVLWERVADPRQFPFSLPVIRHLRRLEFHPKVTFIVGENGSGKSTLMESIAEAYGLNPEGGTQNFAFSTRKYPNPLVEVLRLSKSMFHPQTSFFLRSESYFNVGTEIERLDKGPGGVPIINHYGGISLHEQSHGESFFALFRHRFSENGLYFLDEPESALSPTRQLEFLALMHERIRQGGQFIIATHSPIIMAYPDARILVIDNGTIRETPYQKTEHYRVTRGFLDHPEKSLAHLFSEEVPNPP